MTDSDVCGRLAVDLDLTDFNERELRGSKIGAAASVVASHGPVRRALFEMQQAFARQPGGAVLDGRDIGTVIAPNADLKFWVDADVAVRAGRRYRELAGMGEPVTEAEVLAQLRERDLRDSTRKDAPMKAAAHAHRIDTTAMTPDQVFEVALKVTGTALTGAQATAAATMSRGNCPDMPSSDVLVSVTITI